MFMDEEMYFWFNKWGKRIRKVRGEKGLKKLLELREYSVQLRMEMRGISREEALKDWGTIVKAGNPPMIVEEDD